jgi:hypothetical protein
MSITVGSSTFQVACELVQPVARKLPEDDLFSLVDRIEQALDEAINPPAFMNAATAARYVRRRFDILLTIKGGPPYRRLGSQHVFAREDLDAWAQQRIVSARPIASALHQAHATKNAQPMQPRHSKTRATRERRPASS